jgi:hypothetical protein
MQKIDPAIVVDANAQAWRLIRSIVATAIIVSIPWALALTEERAAHRATKEEIITTTLRLKQVTIHYQNGAVARVQFDEEKK